MSVLSRTAMLVAALSICGAPFRARAADIAFTPEFSGNVLYVLNPESHSVSRKALGLWIQDLTYSPARKAIAFVGSRTGEGRTHLFLMSWPTAKPQRIPDAPNNAAPYRPKFDPDGKNIFAVNYGPVIFRYSLEAHDWKEMPVEGVADPHVQDLAFSPSGRFAAISPGKFKGFLIATVGKDQFNVDRTVLIGFDSCTSANWLDDTHIVFLGRKTPGLQFVWTLDLQTGKTVQLTHEPLGTRDFMSLSSSDRRLVFTATNTEVPEWTLWSLSVDAPTPVQLLPGKRDDSYLFPIWLD